MSDIKDYREKELKNYALGNILVTLYLTNLLRPFVGGESMSLLAMCAAVIESAVVSSLLYVYVFLMDSLLPSEYKYSVCFPGHEKMPGFTIFTDIRDKKRRAKDARFTVDSVINKYQDIYQKLDAEADPVRRKQLQNECWNQIYRRREHDPRVSGAHRDFLLCRDMAVLTLWFLAAYLCLCGLSVLPFSRRLTLFLIVEFFAAAIAGRGKGCRFVKNVIASDLHAIKDNKTEK